MKRILALALIALCFGGLMACTAPVAPSSWQPSAPAQDAPANVAADGGAQVDSQSAATPTTVDAGAPQPDAGGQPTTTTDDGGSDAAPSPTMGNDAQPPSTDDAGGQPAPDSGNPPSTDDAGTGPATVSVTCVDSTGHGRAITCGTSDPTRVSFDPGPSTAILWGTSDANFPGCAALGGQLGANDRMVTCSTENCTTECGGGCCKEMSLAPSVWCDSSHIPAKPCPHGYSCTTVTNGVSSFGTCL